MAHLLGSLVKPNLTEVDHAAAVFDVHYMDHTNIFFCYFRTFTPSEKVNIHYAKIQGKTY